MIPLDQDTLIYVSNDAIRRLEFSFSDILPLVERVFSSLHTGTTKSVPKVGIDVSPGQFFHAMLARDDEECIAGLKWVSVAQEIHGLIVLSDLTTGLPVAILDGRWITGVRPAAVTVTAARRLANPASSRVGFVACGLQARNHLDALRQSFPLREVVCYSRTPESANRFVDYAEQAGLQAVVTDCSADVLDRSDIVVTSVPRGSAQSRDLDPWLLAPGCFVSGVDLSRSWDDRKIDRFDLIVTDDIAQSRKLCGPGLIPWRERFDTDLASIVVGAYSASFDAQKVVMFVHPGIGACDIVIAAEIVNRALKAGYALRVPR